MSPNICFQQNFSQTRLKSGLGLIIMKTIVLATGVLGSLFLAGAASAQGIDRSGQGIGLMFEEGTYFELSLDGVMPVVSGNDVGGGPPTGDVTLDFLLPGGGVKADVTDSLSLGLLFDTPFGVDVLYAPTSTMLGDSAADINSAALAGVVRYEFNDQFSIHGGVRGQMLGGSVNLNGLAWGALNGYGVTLADSIAFGFLVGGAFELPEAGLRVAVTYNSAITHTLATEETLGAVVLATSPTTATTPQSLNVDAQVDIMADTYLFGGFRWVDGSAFDVSSPFFIGVTGGARIIDPDDTTAFNLGVGHAFDEAWSGAFSLQYTPGGDPLVSAFLPVNGSLGATASITYAQDQFKITGSAGYTRFGDASAETGTPDAARADFTGGGAFRAGIKLGFTL